MFQNKPVPRAERHSKTEHSYLDSGTYTVDPTPWNLSEVTLVEHFTKDQKGQISDGSYDVIEAVLNANVLSPTNPAVLLKAAREWYLAHGGHSPVLTCIIEQLCEVEGLIVTNFELVNFKKARKEFEEATHVQQPA